MEDTHSEGEGDCVEASTETSFDNSPPGPEDWTVEEVAEWLWNLEGDKHRRRQT